MMGCNRCRHGHMHDPMYDSMRDPMYNNGRYNDHHRYMDSPTRMHHRRREHDFTDTDEFRPRRRRRAIIIGFPRFF